MTHVLKMTARCESREGAELIGQAIQALMDGQRPGAFEWSVDELEVVEQPGAPATYLGSHVIHGRRLEVFASLMWGYRWMTMDDAINPEMGATSFPTPKDAYDDAVKALGHG